MQTDDLPPLPEPWIRDFSAAPDAQHHFALDQMQERDQMWLARLSALHAENDKLRADADRYQWLRGRCVVHLLNDEVELRAYVRGKTVAGIDAAIDAARAITGDSNG